MRALIFGILLLSRAALGNESPVTVCGPETNANGFPTYTLTSPYQGRPTAIEVLTPDVMAVGKRYPVIYLLPVNDGIMNQWGSGIVEARKHDIHNRFQAICVSPEYDYTPWYGDHPTDAALAQESYLLKAVIPMVEERFPVVPGPDGRILLGFSKSGFGAISIALRHLDYIGKAAAWDAPLMMEHYFTEEEEMVRVFGTPENFDGYAIPGLVANHAAALQGGAPRLVLVSNANPNDTVTGLHHSLDSAGIPHHFVSDVHRAHTWTSGWLPVVVSLLFDE